MIVTVTPNPSLDRTVTLATPLTRGAVHRVSSVTTEPGGKGVNVARALSLAGVDAVALLPASGTDPMVTALQGSGVPFRCVPITAPVRTNIAVTEMDGTTTKINEPGAELDEAAIDALTRSVVGNAEHASWVVMSGSLPPGMPDSWYADVVALLAPYDCKVAIDTSDRPLAALVDGFDRAAPDLIKPNAEELAGVIGFSPQALEAAVAQGDPEPVVSAAQRLRRPRRRRGAGHPRRRGRGAGQRHRQLAGHPAADRPAQHRRRRRLQPGRLRPRRRRWRRATATAADGRRLRQRRGRTAGLRTAQPRRDRPRCRSGDADFDSAPARTNSASS